MWFRKKKIVAEPIRKKRKPKEWDIPENKAAEIIGLYDDMIQAMTQGLTVNPLCARRLPRFLFWQKVIEVIPDTRGYSVEVAQTNDRFCIKIIETVADDDFDTEILDVNDLPTIEQSLDVIEAKPDRVIGTIVPGAN
jgi:hypothetical protein